MCANNRSMGVTRGSSCFNALESRARWRGPGRISGFVHGSHRTSFDASPRGGPDPVRADAASLPDRPETCCPCTGGGGGDEHRAESEELVGLDDDRVAGTTLLVAACCAGRRESEDLASNHVQSGRGGASWASCSRISRISSRSCSSAARRSLRFATPSVSAAAPPPREALYARLPSPTNCPPGRSRAHQPRHRRGGHAATEPCSSVARFVLQVP